MIITTRVKTYFLFSRKNETSYNFAKFRVCESFQRKQIKFVDFRGNGNI
jgi:hypothetical protein